VKDHDLLARLAAANPVPTDAPAREPEPLRLRPAWVALAAALTAATIGIPTVALADDIGGLFGFSNEGTPVPTTATTLAQASGLNEAMQELGFPSTLQLLGQRDGVSFYAARRANGVFCFAVASDFGRGVGCDLARKFPSPGRPILDFSRFSHGARLAGFAADGVATMTLVDPSGATIASAPVIANIYAAATTPPGAAGVQALDAQGNVVYARSFDQAP
jgi:hypothetical protein